jgi:hypothetical protein
MISFDTFVAPKDQAICWGVYTTTAVIQLSVPDTDGNQTVTLKGKVCKTCECEKDKPKEERFTPTPGAPGESHTDTAKYCKRQDTCPPDEDGNGIDCEYPEDAEECVEFDGSDKDGNIKFAYVREKFVQRVKNLQKDALRTAVQTLAPCE